MNSQPTERPNITDQAFERRLADEPESGRFVEPRSWLNQTTDEVSSWFGNVDAMRRRQRDKAVGDHSGEGPKSETNPDARIADQVSQHLTADHELDASRVDIACEAGVVTLNGEVTTLADKNRAQHLAAAVSGVVRVQDNLLVE
jgi:osmotically-inducible protein OsmY